ncbi:MAG: nucleoside triphosphate pyrophosphohydrolase [Acidobacteria bacterium]|nr:nucleoside triphosphate pyrophosphohydrolase [Acidobacteriota bacterium]
MEHRDATTDLALLTDLVARLRGPGGCPWDREQTLPDLRAYLIEEAHELAAAIDGGDWDEIRGELGDLLFQTVFIAELAREAGAFDTAAALQGIHDKMIARHPHVFGDEELADADAVRAAWELRKARQREAGTSILSGVPASLPALTGAYRISQKVAGVGFDWPDTGGVLDKIDEELAEVREALAEAAAAGEESAGREQARVREEIGDLLFSVANLARKLDIDPEAALAATNLEFRRRFAHVERRLVERHRPLGEADLDEMEELWQEAKKAG